MLLKYAHILLFIAPDASSVFVLGGRDSCDFFECSVELTYTFKTDAIA